MVRAKRVLDAWKKKVNKHAEAHHRRVNEEVRHVQEKILFSTAEEALAAVQSFERSHSRNG